MTHGAFPKSVNGVGAPETSYTRDNIMTQVLGALPPGGGGCAQRQ